MDEPYFRSHDVTIWNADARDAASLLAPASVDAIVTSPPYFGLRDYGVDGQIGVESTPAEYVESLSEILTSCATALKAEGSLWLNLGDTYAGRANGGPSVGPSYRHDRADVIPPRVSTVATAPYKSLLMIPERVALVLIERGWILRNRVVWAKPNGMPTSVQDRLATRHEALFHFVRQPRYHYDLDAIREDYSDATLARYRTGFGGNPETVYGAGSVRRDATDQPEVNPAGKNPGDVWSIPTQPYPEAHFAVFPPELVRRPILATVPEGGTVLDPFFGAGTTALMARRLGGRAIGIELSPDYCALSAGRFQQDVLPIAATT